MKLITLLITLFITLLCESVKIYVNVLSVERLSCRRHSFGRVAYRLARPTGASRAGKIDLQCLTFILLVVNVWGWSPDFFSTEYRCDICNSPINCTIAAIESAFTIVKYKINFCLFYITIGITFRSSGTY